MRWTLFKILMFFMAGMLTAGIFVPWIISNKVLPIWANICLITVLLYAWLCVVDWIVKKSKGRSCC